MKIKQLLSSIINVGIQNQQDRTFILKVQMLNIDAIMGLVVPILAMLLHFFEMITLPILINVCLVCTIAASIGVFIFNANKKYDFANIFFLLFFLFVIPFVSLHIGKVACVHFLLIPVGISGFIYFLGRPFPSLLFFSTYLSVFAVLFFIDFDAIHTSFPLTAETLDFVRKLCVVCVAIILSYKMFGLVLIYEELLRNSHDSKVWFKNLYHFSPIGIAVSDDKGKLLKMNPALCKILGYEEEELVGLSAAAVSVEEDRIRERAAAMDIWNGKRDNYSIEKRYVRKDGQTIWSNLSLAAIRNEENELIYAVGMIEDISNRKKQERIIAANIEELNLKNQELEKYIESNMQLEHFAYVASHDLKEPLCSIQGLVDLLAFSANDRLSEEEKMYIDMLKSSNNNMQELIQDLLMYSRVNSQPLKIDIVNVKQLIRGIQLDLRTRINEKNARIEMHQIPTAINGDPTRIRQLLQNLITNGLKFQKEGVQPVVTVSCEDAEQEWIFAVKDNGIGIKPEFHDKIFMLFRRLHARSEFEGTGIGLSVCKKIAEQHGGNIWLESVYGEGTTFFFSISKQSPKINKNQKTISNKSLQAAVYSS